MKSLRLFATMFALLLLVASGARSEDSLGGTDREALRSEYRDQGEMWQLEEDDEQEETDREKDARKASGPGRLTIYDDKRKRVQQLRKNDVFNDRYDIYDEKGRREGRVEKNTSLKGRYDVYDERGRRTQQLRESPIIEGQYDVYDEKGRRVGRVKKRSYSDDTYDVYDDKGRRIRTIEGD